MHGEDELFVRGKPEGLEVPLGTLTKPNRISPKDKAGLPARSFGYQLMLHPGRKSIYECQISTLLLIKPSLLALVSCTAPTSTETGSLANKGC